MLSKEHLEIFSRVFHAETIGDIFQIPFPLPGPDIHTDSYVDYYDAANNPKTSGFVHGKAVRLQNASPMQTAIYHTIFGELKSKLIEARESIAVAVGVSETGAIREERTTLEVFLSGQQWHGNYVHCDELLAPWSFLLCAYNKNRSKIVSHRDTYDILEKSAFKDILGIRLGYKFKEQRERRMSFLNRALMSAVGIEANGRAFDNPRARHYSLMCTLREAAKLVTGKSYWMTGYTMHMQEQDKIEPDRVLERGGLVYGYGMPRQGS